MCEESGNAVAFNTAICIEHGIRYDETQYRGTALLQWGKFVTEGNQEQHNSSVCSLGKGTQTTQDLETAPFCIAQSVIMSADAASNLGFPCRL